MSVRGCYHWSVLFKEYFLQCGPVYHDRLCYSEFLVLVVCGLSFMCLRHNYGDISVCRFKSNPVLRCVKHSQSGYDCARSTWNTASFDIITPSNYSRHDSLSLSLSLSVLIAISPGGSGLANGQYQNVSVLDYAGAKDDGGGVDNWSCKACNAPVKTSPPTNQHPVLDTIVYIIYKYIILRFMCMGPCLCNVNLPL